MTTQIEKPSSEYYFHHFQEAVARAYHKFLLPDQQAEVMELILHDTTMQTFFMAFTPDNMSALIERVFKSVVVRDFILSTYSLFSMRIDKTGEEWKYLVERLAKSYAITDAPGVGDGILIPGEVARRIPKYNNIFEALDGNGWLVVLAMLDQCMGADDFQRMTGHMSGAKKK